MPNYDGDSSGNAAGGGGYGGYGGDGGFGTNTAGFSSGGAGGDINTILEQILNPEEQNVFQQAAGLQSGAITEAGAVETDFLNQAMQQIQGLLGLSGGATTAGGLDDALSQILGGDQFGTLVEERQRGITGQLAAGGLTRSGAAITEGARVPTDLAFDIENMLAGRQSEDRAFTGDVTGQIAQLLAGIGGTQGGAIRGAAEAEASGILGEKQFEFQQSQANQQSQDNTMGTIITGLALAFSDPRLKENIKELGKIGPLTLVEWDWKTEAPDIVKVCRTTGFLSTEVKKHYPEHVSSFGGFDVIHYEDLSNAIN